MIIFFSETIPPWYTPLTPMDTQEIFRAFASLFPDDEKQLEYLKSVLPMATVSVLPEQPISDPTNNEDTKDTKEVSKDICFSFGRHKGMPIKSLLSSSKGLSYIQWCLNTVWFTPEAFPDMHAEINRLGISKNCPKRFAPPIDF